MLGDLGYRIVRWLCRWFGWFPGASESAALILLYRRGPMLGLDLVRMSDGWLGRGQVYLVLHRLEDIGEVRSAVANYDQFSRRIYAITALGRARLSREKLLDLSQTEPETSPKPKPT